MDSEVKPRRSLPPLVEGKIHGSLSLVIDEILWTRSFPGDVTVVASWWGEHDSAQFRPIANIENVERINEDRIEVYDIKTNAALFEDYVKNCQTIELIVVTQKSHQVIGTAHVTDLSKIFAHKLYSQYVPILSIDGSKIGEIHISMQLIYSTKSPNMQLKTCKHSKKQDDDILLSTVDDLQYSKETPAILSRKNMDNTKEKNSVKVYEVDDMCDTYTSVLKSKRSEFQESKKKLDGIVTDKLVAQIVARAQRLRGAILRETYNEDLLALSDSSMSNGSYPYASVEREAKLYEYILGKEMTSSEEKKALDTLKSTSPTPSLIDLASETITTYKYDDTASTRLKESSHAKSNSCVEEMLCKKITYTKPKGTHPLDYVNSIRIFVESFILSSAGYRRAKSTCLQHGVPLTLTYFIQYDTTFGSARRTNVKSNKETRFVRTCAKKQMGQVIDFNSEGVYSISRHIINRDFLLKFKIFVRHLNQKLLTELGCGSINIVDTANSINLSSTQSISIVNKGIKVGELKVTTELGCDLIHFGKEFVDAVISTKENIPVLEIKSLANINDNKYRNVTGTHSSKSSSKVSSVSAKRIECLTNDNDKDLITAKDMSAHRGRSLDNKKIDTSNPETGTKDKVLLHGLIYVAEGKNLPESNTYLICRAFWREDKAASQICSNTKNPFYHFCQLVPLIHGVELLERIRDNYIIVEVYGRQSNGTDNLVGIAKLPVHQLYIAYRDPLVLPHLLLSKYPVISVDGWVSINDPINRKFCGELLALVALGTAEQIASLEISRGLRNISLIPQTVGNYHHFIPDNTKCAMSIQESSQCNVPEVSNNSGRLISDNNFAYRICNTPDQELAFVNYKTQEVQTDISVLKDSAVQETPFADDMVSNDLLNTSANACILDANKICIDQSAQTGMKQTGEEKIDRELCLNTLNNNNLSDDNDSYSPRNNFQLSTEMYRSVGVGAEYDEESDQQQNNAYNNPSNSSISEENSEKNESNTNCDSGFFNVVIEIERALHLPKIEKPNGSVEPSTYVTFQELTVKPISNGQLNPYMITNVFPYSCNPKWNWRCDAKLPTELLLNNEKRLIFKVWQMIDPGTATVINAEMDIVIGSAAVDLSVLMAGLPTVSGWFHIIDFIGRCNGQIKISITPLDNLAAFGKLVSFSTNNLPVCNNFSHINWSDSYNASCANIEANDTQQMLSHINHNKDRSVQNDGKCDEPTSVMDTGNNLESVSLSILSLSLKQKLDELQEITKRLQSRLHDVTNTAFEDEFDSDFEANESNSENEYIDNKNVEIVSPMITTHTTHSKTLQTQRQQCDMQTNQNSERQSSSVICNAYNPQFEHASNQSKAINPETTDTGYCSSSNTHFSQYSRHYQCQNSSNMVHNYSSDSSAEYPARGTKTHISHLLDKLSLDLPPKPPAGTDMPMKKNIIDLFAKLREHRNFTLDKNENSRGVDMCSVPTQTDNTNEHRTYFNMENSAISDTSDVCIDESVPRSIEELQSGNKISTVIREELVAEEDDDVAEFDDLTTYLLTTNIRCTNLHGVVNPLLYQYLVPDSQITSTASPEGEAVEQLDNRYAKSFNIAMNSNRIGHSADNAILSQIDTQMKNRTNGLEKSTEFRLTSSGVLENDNIDMTIHKSSNNDLMSSDSTESTITTSFKKLSTQQTDTETENYCFTVSESSVPGVSRQAPDGGNPVEEVKTSTTVKQQDNEAQNTSAVS